MKVIACRFQNANIALGTFPMYIGKKWRRFPRIFFAKLSLLLRLEWCKTSWVEQSMWFHRSRSHSQSHKCFMKIKASHWFQCSLPSIYERSNANTEIGTFPIWGKSKDSFLQKKKKFISQRTQDQVVLGKFLICVLECVIVLISHFCSGWNDLKIVGWNKASDSTENRSH
jgi:hypothetical protein